MPKKATKSKVTVTRRRGPIKDAAGSILNNSEFQQNILMAIVGLIGKLFNKQNKPAPEPLPPVITKPVPNPGETDPNLPDDVIPGPPASNRRVKNVRLRLAGAQLNRQRFPEAKNDGLIPGSDLRQIEAGAMALNYASKFWLDLTAYDHDGKEFLPDAVISHGLCYRTEHHAGDAFIKGHGGEPQQPTEGYETNDTNEIGNGITSWISTLGFKHQMKAHAEGTFECWGMVDGVRSNSFTIRVS